MEKLIDHIAEKDDSAGYDIKSYNLVGTERLKEVKSTTQKVGSNSIYLSANELDIATKSSNYYFMWFTKLIVKHQKFGELKAQTCSMMKKS